MTAELTISRDHYEELRDVFRADVLNAMDCSMNRIHSSRIVLNFPDNCVGARDEDLPALFERLDRQFRLNLKHGGIWAIIGGPGDYEIL